MKIKITKGCKARDISKGVTCSAEATQLGAEYGHFVRLVIAYRGANKAFYVRHANRLNDSEVSANDGNPLHVIKFRIVKEAS
jgi:hypothetical protein